MNPQDSNDPQDKDLLKLELRVNILRDNRVLISTYLSMFRFVAKNIDCFECNSSPLCTTRSALSSQEIHNTFPVDNLHTGKALKYLHA